LGHGRIEADERKDRDGEDHEHKHECRDAALRAEARLMISSMQATKIARFLICSGKSAIPNPNALGGDMELIDSIHLGGGASGSGEWSRLLRPRTMSRVPIVALMTRPTVEMAPSAPPKRRRPKIPIPAQVVKYPSARAPALEMGLWELKSRMVRRSKGGAIEPPMAKTMSPGRVSLMKIPLAVIRTMRNRSRRFRAGRQHRRTGYHRFWVSLPMLAPVTLV
jgi:hypothetical protein